MKPEFAPPHILFAALKTLHCAAYTTRNLCLDRTTDHTQQIYDLWEAMHEVPDILTRWRGEETEKELQMYLKEYTEKWKQPDLQARYNDCLDDEHKS
ncbi:MAG: hypothetical protein U1F77_14540 [Kiritimatiellia bacterium]